MNPGKQRWKWKGGWLDAGIENIQPYKLRRQSWKTIEWDGMVKPVPKPLKETLSSVG